MVARFHPLFLVALALFGIPFHGVMMQSATSSSNNSGSNNSGNSGCTGQPVQRQEWRSLNSGQKANYIKAVRCLQGLPPKTAFAGVKSRFDDFQALHVNMTAVVHFVGQFLPWHRLFVVIYEDALRKECNYAGPDPYWDWTQDSANITQFTASPIFDPQTGFGGNGDSGNAYCVKDGPFSTYNLSLGPGTIVNNHCLTRQFNSAMLPKITASAVQNATIQPTFEIFRTELEGNPPIIKSHGGGHLGVGGDLGNLYSSPGDPLFYLHHAQIDRIWWQWQMIDPNVRLSEVSGRNSTTPPSTNITLDFPLTFGTLAPSVPIRDVMDISSLCYSY